MTTDIRGCHDAALLDLVVEHASAARACARPFKPALFEHSPTESPDAAVGASDRSMMPNGMPSRRDASWATSWPTRVI